MRNTLTAFILLLSGKLFAQSEPRLVLPIGHTESINSTSFSSNGKYMVSASDDYTCILYECISGKEILTLIGHSGPVVSAEFITDGTRILTASKDSTIRIWDIQSGKEIKRTSFEAPFSGLILSPNGNEFASLTSNGTIDIWKTNNGEFIRTIKTDYSEVSEIVYSPNGLQMAIAACDSSINLYNIVTGQIEKSFQGNSNCVSSIRFSPDGKLLLSTSSDNAARLWDVETGRTIWICNEFTDYVFSGEFNSDGDKIVLAGANNFAVICDLKKDFEVTVLSGHTGILLSAHFSPDCKHVITSAEDNTVRIWNSANGDEERVISFEPFATSSSFVNEFEQSQSNTYAEYGAISYAIFFPGGKDFLMVCRDHSMKSFDTSTGMFESSFRGKSIVSYGSKYLQDGSSIVSPFIDHSIVIWNSQSGKPLKTFSAKNSGNLWARLGKEENIIAASYNNDSILIWDRSSGQILKVIKDDFKIQAFALSTDSKHVAAVYLDNIVRIWNIQNGKLITTITGHNNPVNKCLFSPNGETILTTANENVAYLWSVASGELIQEFLLPNEEIYSADFNSNGRLLTAVSYNGFICVWNVESGDKLAFLETFQQGIDGVDFSSKGDVLFLSNNQKVFLWNFNSNQIEYEFQDNNNRLSFSILSGDEANVLLVYSNGKMDLFDRISGNKIRTFKGHNQEIYSASFSSNSTYLIASSADHKTILWDVQTGKIIYTRLQLENNDWLIYDEDYRFDGSPGAIEKLYFTCGLEIIELGQMKDALYVPGLAEKLMNGEDVNYKKLSEIDICGALPLIEKLKEDNSGWQFSIQQRRWPIVRIEVKVDGKIVKTLPLDQFIFIQNMAMLDLKRAELEKFFVNGKENKISISAITKENGVEIISRGIDVFVLSEESKDPPQMYLLMIGVNDYKDDALDLRFPVQDARALSNAIEMSTSKMLGAENVHVYHVESKLVSNEVFTTPERAGVMKALADIGSKAKANDLLFIFFAGHGVMQGQADKSFTFLTADASQINQIGISTNDLKLWLSPEGPYNMLPNKTVMVYDACNSGQAAKELVAALTRDDDATERRRQIEELGDKSGLFILSASAPNKPAYELPQLGQGILTYSLLYTLKNNPSILDQEVDGNGYLNLQKWFLATEQEQSRRMEALGLKQDAQPYGSGNIRLGLVDNELRKSIQLADEKPLVFCANARDDNDEDPLELKKAVNDYFEHALSRGSDSPFAYVSAETSQANVIKLIYSIKKEKVECRILVFKNKVKIQESTVSASLESIPSKIAETVSNLIVH